MTERTISRHLELPAPRAATGRVDSGADRDGRARAVCIRFSASELRRLRRREPDRCSDGQPIWTERPLLLQRADGRLYLMGTSAHFDGLARWILSFAGDAEVESPPALRRHVRSAAHRVLALYRSDPDASADPPPSEAPAP
jgi:predicted DNA-binding transcriptional regulator YafY